MVFFMCSVSPRLITLLTYMGKGHTVESLECLTLRPPSAFLLLTIFMQDRALEDSNVERSAHRAGVLHAERLELPQPCRRHLGAEHEIRS